MAGRDRERDGTGHGVNTDRGPPEETIRRSPLDPAPARARRRIVLLSYGSVFIFNRGSQGTGFDETNPPRIH